MRKTNSQTIYEKIKDDIIYLRRKPGEEINILTLSEEENVSRSPIRDALMLLQSESLVDIFPQKGSWVSKIDLERVAEERLLRFSLENCVLDSYSKCIKNSDLAKMEYYIELQKEALEKGDNIGFYASDDEMHHIFYSGAALERFWFLIKKESGNYRRIRLLSLSSRESVELNIRQHLSLLNALKEKDFEKAHRVLQEHLSKLDCEEKEIVKKYPEYFKEK